ncbi:MFS transporter [Dolosigranulum pigrum]|nr:MFS transporter [Dolosigranulum pigrum]QTJ59463.1 MFS transporter [Dolosigranulum pigrum]
MQVMIGLGMAIFDGSLAMGYIIQSTIHQGLSPDNILARAGSAYYLIGGLFSMIGTAAAGLLPDLFNGHIALMIGSVVLGIIACAMYLFRDYGQPVDEIDLIVLEEK